MEQLDSYDATDALGADAGWSVLIYQTTSVETQQEILLRVKSFCRDDMPMLGTSSGPEHYVIAECSNEQEQRLVGRTVSTVDRKAQLVHIASPWSRLHRMRTRA